MDDKPVTEPSARAYRRRADRVRGVSGSVGAGEVRSTAGAPLGRDFNVFRCFVEVLAGTQTRCDGELGDKG